MERKPMRIAANTIDTGLSKIEPGVVEIDNGLVVSVAPLTEEREATLWVTGTITLKPNADGHGLEAFHNETMLK